MNQHHFFTTYIWDALNVNANQMNQFFLERKRRNVWITYFCCSNWKITRKGKNPHAKIVAWERNWELTNKKTEQLYKVSSLCLDDHQILEGRTWISERIIGSVLTNCLKKACIWPEVVDLPFYGQSTNLPSHKWLPSILSCAKHSTALSIRVISRLWHCWRPGRFEIDFRRNVYFSWRPWRFEINVWRSFVHFWMLHICTYQLDVSKSKLQYHTVLQNLKLYLWMLVCKWMVYLLLTCGIS